jgi:hypothetical protein
MSGESTIDIKGIMDKGPTFGIIMIECLFHNSEHMPTMMIDVDSGKFYCYECRKSGKAKMSGEILIEWE